MRDCVSGAKGGRFPPLALFLFCYTVTTLVYYVYILKCRDGTLYTGSTNDVERRVRVHNDLKTGARYTKSRRPVSLVYSEKLRTLSRGLKREWEIKKMSRREKLLLIGAGAGKKSMG